MQMRSKEYVKSDTLDRTLKRLIDPPPPPSTALKPNLKIGGKKKNVVLLVAINHKTPKRRTINSVYTFTWKWHTLCQAVSETKKKLFMYV